jgi:hypothetical protein
MESNFLTATVIEMKVNKTPQIMCFRLLKKPQTFEFPKEDSLEVVLTVPVKISEQEN